MTIRQFSLKSVKKWREEKNDVKKKRRKLSQTQTWTLWKLNQTYQLFFLNFWLKSKNGNILRLDRYVRSVQCKPYRYWNSKFVDLENDINDATWIFFCKNRPRYSHERAFRSFWKMKEPGGFLTGSVRWHQLVLLILIICAAILTTQRQRVKWHLNFLNCGTKYVEGFSNYSWFHMLLMKTHKKFWTA